jgi:hypothetical protein
MRSTGNSTGKEITKEEANHLRATRTFDGRQRQGKQLMIGEEQMKEEEERHRREILNKRSKATVEDMRRTRTPTTPARSIRPESAAAQTRPATTEEPVAREQRNSANASAARQGTNPTPWRL